MLVHEVDQKSEEWFAIRKGKMTASHAQAIGNDGKGLETYITELMAEYYSIGERDTYTSKHMDRGNDLEEQARVIYELETGNEVSQVGFVEYNKFAGCSPDGLVDDKGEIEIKCPDDKGYFKYLLYGEKAIDSCYIWQMQMQLLVTKREWCDFVAYNPNFHKSIFIVRIFADKDKHEKLLAGFKTGEELIGRIKEKLNAD